MILFNKKPKGYAMGIRKCLYFLDESEYKRAKLWLTLERSGLSDEQIIEAFMVWMKSKGLQKD